jgi:hypothetical protein
VEFPFETQQNQDRYREWETEYNAKAAPYATSRYLTSFGGSNTLSEFEALINYHDQETKASSGLPLA